MRGNVRQLVEGPLAALDVLIGRHDDCQQMADGRGNHVVVVLEKVLRLVTRRPEHAGDIGRDRRFLCDDECFPQNVFRLTAVSNGAWPGAAKSCGAENGEKSKPSQSPKNNWPSAADYCAILPQTAQSLARALIWLAPKPAPKPLSMFTTVTPLPQLLSMPSSAATPPKLAP